ncbi:2-hydroxychromene-2-carboxylate isomerase [Maricaulis sp.]|jgi:2-hydroxychromene-2-carboxylate isomerase|uniref:2-hydroxychromene-2-carboxylate isomerase n=1 Tax=Maricaulis sp. TaxID=1486257 RepID=UPI000C597FF3|nr:2-hydroxychromene-2-carboxylate isomerase [Maricaulis sp.]MAC90527.1 disulfide bond formation protein DsbA [Maricaulis sp.]
MAEIEYLIDFASPNAWLAHKALPGLLERTGATVRYTPVLLGGLFKLTGNQAPMIAYADIPNKLAYEGREFERFIERHGITGFRFNPHFPVNTLLLMRMAVAAEQDGVLPAFIEAGFHHMWEDPKNMSDATIIADALADSGLDVEALLAAAGTPDVKSKLIANTEDAVARGAFGIPSFFVKGELYFGKNTLDEIERVIAAP